MPEFLDVDDLSFEVRRSERRKTVSILVDRGGQLVVSAPAHCDQSTLLSVIRDKKQWIYTQLRDKERTLVHTPPLKEYLSGEGFFYLGKSYRLQLVQPDPTQARTPILRFFRSQFFLRADERFNGRRHFVEWYMTRCNLWLETHLPHYAQRIGVEVPQWQVMDLGYRWGSCSKSQANFHWRIIMLPVPILEYVLLHELAHIIEPKHGPQFWQVVERTLPDWQEKERWLAENGVVYSL